MNWISVEKRLPTETGAYLVYCGGEMKGHAIAIYSHRYGKFHFKNVTHWMPLPLPPDKQKGQDKRHARWVRHEPNPEAMEEFHKMGIGKGMGINSIYWTCSRCGCWGTPHQNFCPNCGARMKAGE